MSLGLGGAASAVLIGLAAATGGSALMALPLVAIMPVMAPGLFTAGHRFLNTKAAAPPTCGGIRVTVSVMVLCPPGPVS